MGQWIVLLADTGEIWAIFRTQEHALTYMEDHEQFPMEYTLAFQAKEIGT